MSTRNSFTPLAFISDDMVFIAVMAMELSFFQKVRAVDTSRDYTILIDKSGSMSGGRWRDVRTRSSFHHPLISIVI